MADRRGCSCRTSISGRARSGFAVSASFSATRLDSGSSSAITIAETPGMSSGIRAIPEVALERATAAPTRLEWRVATGVSVRAEKRQERTLVRDVPRWPGHRAGQHVDVRLVAEDGYQAQRSYSIASAPESPTLELTIERLEDGEVSPYLCDVLQPGDGLELRGPIGGYFVWEVTLTGPLLLVAGGGGGVPPTFQLLHPAGAPAGARGPGTPWVPDSGRPA